jgi:hypothetical protein
MAVTVADPISELGRWLDELARKWERFFARDPHVPQPPEREKAALERRLRELSEQEFSATADKFRMQQLLSRSATYSNLWQRQLRIREEARDLRGEGGGPPPNVLPKENVATGDGDLAGLHARYVEGLRAAGGAGDVGFEAFSDAVAAQRRALEQRGAHVEGFDIFTEDGQVKVRARVRRGRKV